MPFDLQSSTRLSGDVSRIMAITVSFGVQLKAVFLTGLLAICAGDGIFAQDRPVGAPARLATSSGVTTTNHPPLPATPALFWLAPEASAARPVGRVAPETALARVARGITLIDDANYAGGLPLVGSTEAASTPLDKYAKYYTGVALLGLKRVSEADAVFERLDDHVEGYLKQALALRMAEAALARDDEKKASDILDDLSDDKVIRREDVLLRLAEALERAGDRDKSFKVYSRIYYESPLSDEAIGAQAAMERLQTPELIPSDRFTLELGRAQKLFDARRWAQARAAYVPLARAAQADDSELVALRIAECDYFLERFRASRDALRPYQKGASREEEARFFFLSATRGLGEHDTYEALAREFVEGHADSAWTEETLNNLASHFVTIEEDAEADQVFRELARRFPKGRYAERAAWKIGWQAYKSDQFGDAASTFEAGAVAFPRSDYRPSWLYWAGRSHDQLGERGAANALYRVAASDYLNSYYGRLASALLSERREASVDPIVKTERPPNAPGPVVPTDGVIRALLSVDLFDDAMNEVNYAQMAWGDSPVLQATVALIRNRRGLQESANDRFNDVRGAITQMRRAYPQFLAAGGEELPPEILRVIFPLDYWPLIKKYSDAHGLDPYLMTALIAQESTFTSDVRSSANAVGLMQLIPRTARRYAAKLGMRYSTRLLTQPESNIRMGMKYFKELMDRFGGAHLALASYNAGEQRVARWIAERPGFAQDEFIDDIPFPETQNYVKRILGTADDYRRLYGEGLLRTTPTITR
jgi:soluble lytic murein transglycosylase